MAEKKVGIRELKAKLSGYLQEVKNGHTVVITERGRAVGRILPADESVEDRVQNLVRSGVALWSGKKLKPGRPIAKVKTGRKTLAEIVAENRD
jgi:prevent-host-death family protein